MLPLYETKSTPARAVPLSVTTPTLTLPLMLPCLSNVPLSFLYLLSRTLVVSPKEMFPGIASR